jgi:cytochrome c553
MNRTLLLQSLAITIGLCHAGSTFATAEAEEQKAAAACFGCHGPGGSKPVTADIPRLAGQHYDYLVEAMTAYRTGTRDNPIMGAIAKPLTDEQIRGLAAYFSSQQGLTTKR